MANELFSAQQPGPQPHTGPPAAMPGPPQAPAAMPPQPGAQLAQPGPQARDASVPTTAYPTPTGLMPGQTEFNEEEATPEEQAQYDQLVNKALDFMGKNASQILAGINDKSKPVHENVGEAALQMGMNIKGQASAAGVEISPDVLLGAGAEIIAHLMELADAGGILPFEADSDEYDQELSMALLHATKLAGDEFLKGPGNTPEAQEEAGNFIAQGVAKEVQAGEVDPSFHENIANNEVNKTAKMMGGR